MPADAAKADAGDGLQHIGRVHRRKQMIDSRVQDSSVRRGLLPMDVDDR
jgi:hypothetical protein